jgi:hypothetical protein
MIIINSNAQELEYKGLYFPFRAVKKKILTEGLTDKELAQYCVHKTFNTKTGEIDRKYAWESIFNDLLKCGALGLLLDQIIQEEYLD